MMEERDENILMTQEDLARRKRRTIIDDSSIKKLDEKEDGELKKQKEKIYNRGGKVHIQYESNGRFSIKPILYFNDFTIEDVNNLTLSKQDEILNNLVSILNKIKNEDAETDVSEMLPEEFLETLVGIKQEFNTPMHTHYWICDCQNNVESNQQKINEVEIDLRTLNYVSIEQADETFRQHYKEKVFDTMTPEEFKEYIKTKYVNNEIDINKWTVEDELKTIQIKEPYKMIFNNDEYTFRFMRIKDILKAQSIVDKKYGSKIKMIRMKKYPNIPLSESKIMQEKEIEDIQYQQLKDLSLYARALSLIEKNGKILNHEESLSIYKNLPRSILFDLINFSDSMLFGIKEEKELVCPLCGETTVRSLHREFSPYELLPIDTITKRKQGQHSRPNIFFRI